MKSRKKAPRLFRSREFRQRVLFLTLSALIGLVMIVSAVIIALPEPTPPEPTPTLFPTPTWTPAPTSEPTPAPEPAALPTPSG